MTLHQSVPGATGHPPVGSGGPEAETVTAARMPELDADSGDGSNVNKGDQMQDEEAEQT